MSKTARKSICFAFYKGDKLIGYRQDTVGSIGDNPKIYSYSRSQVETVLKNINYNVNNPTGIGVALAKALGSSPESDLLASVEKDVHEELQGKQAFEVRVVECPDYEHDDEGLVILGSYPYGAMEEWKQYPQNHEVIEVHYFSINGLINQQ